MAILGVIADDFTGATDIAGMLVKNGMRTIQTIGVPPKGAIPDDVDAVVVALKTRSIAAKEAIAQSLAALDALQAAGCKRFFFKYCSTFNSTDAGNIGPVGDALLDALECQAGDLQSGLPGERPHHLLRPSVRGRHPAVRLPHAPSPAESDDGFQPGARAGAPDQAQGRAGAAEAGAGGLGGPARRARQARGRRRAPCRRRCGGRHRPRHHRRGGRRRPSGHRRLGRGARPARRLSPPRTSGAQGQCRHAAQDRRRLRRAGGLVLGGDAGPDRGLQGPAPRISTPTPSAAASRSATRPSPGPRTSSATGRSCCRPATSPKR